MNDPEIKDQIRMLKDQFNVTIDEIRRISNNLMPSVLEVFGITLALKNLCEETEESGQLEIFFKRPENWKIPIRKQKHISTVSLRRP
jgi:signal transduction histidine kinase